MRITHTLIHTLSNTKSSMQTDPLDLSTSSSHLYISSSTDHGITVKRRSTRPAIHREQPTLPVPVELLSRAGTTAVSNDNTSQPGCSGYQARPSILRARLLKKEQNSAQTSKGSAEQLDAEEPISFPPKKRFATNWRTRSSIPLTDDMWTYKRGTDSWIQAAADLRILQALRHSPAAVQFFKGGPTLADIRLRFAQSEGRWDNRLCRVPASRLHRVWSQAQKVDNLSAEERYREKRRRNNEAAKAFRNRELLEKARRAKLLGLRT